MSVYVCGLITHKGVCVCVCSGSDGGLVAALGVACQCTVERDIRYDLCTPYIYMYIMYVPIGRKDTCTQLMTPLGSVLRYGNNAFAQTKRTQRACARRLCSL